MKGVVVNAKRKEIKVIPIPNEIIETREWQDSIENIEYYLYQQTKCKWGTWAKYCTFFIIKDGEELKIIQ